MISLLGTSKLRPLRIIQEIKPTDLCLVTSSQSSWKTYTKTLAREIKKEVKSIFNENEIFTKEVDFTDFNKVFYLLHGIIQEYKEKDKKGIIYMDVSATTGIAMSAAAVVSNMFKDTHVCYLYAKFKPGDVNTIKAEMKKKKEITRQKILELPNTGHLQYGLNQVPHLESEKLTFFISYRMVQENNDLYQLMSDFIRSFGFTVVSASESGRPDLSPALMIKDKIRGSDILLAILTMDVVSEASGKKIYFPSGNVIEEIGEAADKKIIILTEDGVTVPSNISQQKTYIPFNRSNPAGMLLGLVKYMKQIDLF